MGLPTRDLAEHFGANLVRVRKRAGLSQEQLGAIAGLHRTEVGMLERGVRLPRLDTIAKLAGALEVDPGELLAGITWRPAPSSVGGFELSDPGGTGEEEARSQLAALTKRAAALRARQSKQSDAAALAREAREELDERGS
jgi:transcriptional regulator with XRE-family HTH domain